MRKSDIKFTSKQNFLMKFLRALRTRTTPFSLKTNDIRTTKLKLTWILKTIFKQIQPKNAYHLKISLTDISSQIHLVFLVWYGWRKGKYSTADCISKKILKNQDRFTDLQSKHIQRSKNTSVADSWKDQLFKISRKFFWKIQKKLKTIREIPETI